MLRRGALSLAAAVVSQLWLSGTASAQDVVTPPPEQPPAEAAPAPQAPPPEAPAVQPEAPPAVPPPTTGVEEAAGPAERTEEIVVTGTRIRRKDLTTPAPVTVISKEQVLASGRVSIGDFLQTLPEHGNAINTQINNGGDGSTRVNLRGLGEERTLVLLNGRRMVPGGVGADSSVDLNSIPTNAIERIEVLKDGASAIYGSDAIGGVVNIITRRDFNASEVNAQTGISQRGDGQLYDVNAMTGTRGDRGGLMFSAGFYRQEATWAGDRNWSKVPYSYDFGTGEVAIGGSYGVPQGALDLFAAPGTFTGPGSAEWDNITTLYGGGDTTFIYDPTSPSGFAWRALDPATDLYNFQPDNYLVTPQQRISLWASGDTKLGDVARGYFEASYVNRQSQWKIAPEPLFTDSEGLTVSADSIYNPFRVDIDPGSGGIYRRLTEFGNRSEAQDVDTFRVVGGVDGSLSEVASLLEGWFWDANMNYGRTQAVTVKNGNLFLPNLQAAVGPSMDPDGVAGSGDEICVTTPGDSATAIDGCTPLDLFHGAGSITDAQKRALTFTGNHRGTNQMVSVQANVAGDLIPILSDRPIGVAAGYEYRRLSGEFLFDPITAQGLTTGNKGENTEGKYDVHEVYGELSFPIISNVPYVNDLEATVAARAFDYSTFGSDWTYKLGARYKPIPDVTIRGTFSTAFRAPSISDLFSGQADTFPNVSDPCNGLDANDNPDLIPEFLDAPANTIRNPLWDNCEAAGAGTVNNLDGRDQLRGRFGGNPDLDPETADIFTVGVVFEPRWVKNLSATVDYYSVTVDNSISTIGFNQILNSCYPDKAGVTPKFCEFVQRDPASHRVLNIVNLNTNVGGTETAGIDFAVRYALPSPFGRFGFGADVNWLQKFDQELADGTVVEGKGNFDLADQGTYGVFPNVRANAGVTWALGGLGAGVNSRFLNGFRECDNNDCSALSNNPSRWVSAYNIWDAFVSYSLSSGLGKTNVAVGVQNAFDTDPPKIYNGFTASTDPSAYDFMGRFVYARLSQTY